MFVGDFDPIGIGQTPMLIAIGLVVLFGLLIWYLFFREDWDGEFEDPAFDPEGQGSRRGVLLPQYLNVDDLTSIAAQRGIVPNPAWIERGQTSRASADASAPGVGRAGVERGREAREHVEMPRQAVDLVPKLIQGLRETNSVHITLAHAPLQAPDVRSAISDLDGATEFALQHVNDRYPDGIDESFDDVVREIVRALNRKAHEDEIEQKRAEFEAVENDAFVLIESVWRIRRIGGAVQLWLAEWEWVPNAPYEPRHERALPQGIQVKVEFDSAALTERGRRDLSQNGETRRLGVFGTTERFDTGVGRLEIYPIAVFSRVGRTGGGIAPFFREAHDSFS